MMARDAAPRDTYAYISLASVALAENKPEEAVGFYENALSIESTNFNALSGLIRLHARNNELHKAHARIDQVLSTYPNNASLHYLKAQVYGFERNSGQAEVAAQDPRTGSELHRRLFVVGRFVHQHQPTGPRYCRVSEDCRTTA